MKRFVGALLALFLMLSLSLGVTAHPGDTDSQGGHYNRGTGEYHFHHGQPAHQHVNGVCPYEFVDETGKNSGGSGSSSTKETAKANAIQGVKEKKDNKDWFIIGMYGFAAAMFIGEVTDFGNNRKKKKTKLPKSVKPKEIETKDNGWQNKVYLAEDLLDVELSQEQQEIIERNFKKLQEKLNKDKN